MKRVSVRLRALREEFSEAPLEIGGFVEDADLRKVNTSLAQKTKFEEDNMRRLNLSKADKKKAGCTAGCRNGSFASIHYQNICAILILS